MKNNKFYFLTYLIIFILFYFLFGIWGLLEIKKHKDLIFSNKKYLEFHKKYSNKIHHLRDVNKWGDGEDNYLFSKIIFKKDFSNTILLQGDSWIEDISNIKTSEMFVKKFGEDNNFNIYNAGITSFSPSLMHVQYKILKNDFNIRPQVLIINIDQTDIGDEICRYKDKKIYSSEGNLIRVHREEYTRATYDYSKIYLYSELYFSNNFIKVLKFPYLKTQYFLKRNLSLISEIKKKGFRKRNESKCGFFQIQKELINYNSLSEKNFKKSLSEYLVFLSNEKKIKKVYLTSFPHKGHLQKTYKVNVSKYIDEVLLSFDDIRFKHINMNNLDHSKEKIEKIYRKNDPASHLANQQHKDIFLSNIFSKINE
ncbi:hypothetical protein OAI51_00935 [Candidatus Pelagibacter bacterium]|jgi:hypothetical protein|nr:hypothetical protein [Candidatus Pelagibacter bacterium]